MPSVSEASITGDPSLSLGMTKRRARDDKKEGRDDKKEGAE